MEELRLGNTQNQLRTDNKEPGRVHDTVHQSVTRYIKRSDVCITGGKYSSCEIRRRTARNICARRKNFSSHFPTPELITQVSLFWHATVSLVSYTHTHTHTHTHTLTRSMWVCSYGLIGKIF